MRYYYDLHIHSCLSYGCDQRLTPRNIISAASLMGLDVISVADYNAIDNVKAVCRAAKDSPLRVIPAVEVATAEEVHLLCYFSTLEDLDGFFAQVLPYYPDISNENDLLGKQRIVDENDREVGICTRLLCAANTLTIDEVTALVRQYHGAPVPAHIDWDSNCLLTNLGRAGLSMDFGCYEFSSKAPTLDLLTQYPELRTKRHIRNSMARHLEEISPALCYIDLNKPPHQIENADFIRYLEGKDET